MPAIRAQTPQGGHWSHEMCLIASCTVLGTDADALAGVVLGLAATSLAKLYCVHYDGLQLTLVGRRPCPQAALYQHGQSRRPPSYPE